MEFWNTIVRLVRRRGVIIPAVLVALTWGTAAVLTTPKTYVSSTTMVLTTTEYGGTESLDPNEPTPLTNPMLNFNGSLQTTAAILIQTVSTKDALEQLGVLGGTRLIVNDGRTNLDLLGLSGPFLYIEGRSTSADDARRVVVDAQTLMRESLGEWQRTLHAPQKTYVGLVDVVPPTAPEADSGRVMKLGVLAFLFGFALSVGIAYVGQRVRARRRALAAAAPASPDSTPPPAGAPEAIDPNDQPPSSAQGPGGPQGAEPAVIPTAPRKRTERTKAESTLAMTVTRGGPSAAPTPSAKGSQPNGETLKKNGGSTVVSVPLKVNGRSRHR
jgi:hypothetical protein